MSLWWYICQWSPLPPFVTFECCEDFEPPLQAPHAELPLQQNVDSAWVAVLHIPQLCLQRLCPLLQLYELIHISNTLLHCILPIVLLSNRTIRHPHTHPLVRFLQKIRRCTWSNMTGTSQNPFWKKRSLMHNIMQSYIVGMIATKFYLWSWTLYMFLASIASTSSVSRRRTLSSTFSPSAFCVCSFNLFSCFSSTWNPCSLLLTVS